MRVNCIPIYIPISIIMSKLTGKQATLITHGIRFKVTWILLPFHLNLPLISPVFLNKRKTLFSLVLKQCNSNCRHYFGWPYIFSFPVIFPFVFNVSSTLLWKSSRYPCFEIGPFGHNPISHAQCWGQFHCLLFQCLIQCQTLLWTHEGGCYKHDSIICQDEHILPNPGQFTC